ncbi:hypothetical protein BTHI11S_04140 [Bosea thiooxidans]
MTIEELQYLDSDLSAVVEPVAELRRVEAGRMGAGEIDRDRDHLAQRRAQEEVVERDLVDVAAPAGEPEQPADLLLAMAEQLADIPDARRPEALLPVDQRRDARPERLVLGRKPDLVAGQPDP